MLCYAHLILTCAWKSHFDLRVRISFWPARAHLFLTCPCASHFCLRMHISFRSAHAHLIYICSCAFHFGLRLRILFWPAQAHLTLTCARALHFTCARASHLHLLMRISFWPSHAHLALAEWRRAKVRLGVSFIALFTRVGWGSGLYVRVMLYVTQLWVRACVLLWACWVCFANFIFIRSHVLVLVFTSCVGGGKYVLWRNFGCGCKGHMLFPGKRTDFAFWAKLILLAAARVYGRLHTL